MRLPALAIFLLAAAQATVAAVRLPALLSDGVVLPAERPVAIWGWADAGEVVEVVFAGHREQTVAGSDGTWKAMLPPLPPASTEAVLEVRGTNQVIVRDVRVGEVWLAAGQSNMAMTLANARDAAREVAAAHHPELRVFTVESGFTSEPQSDCRGRWVTCTPETAAKFSAVGYFFAQALRTGLNRPVGLVVSAWGATAIQAWTSLPAQQGVPDLAPVLARQFSTSVAGPGRNYDEIDRKNAPGVLFNAMIAPLRPFRFRGVIWYQGENNTREVAFARLYGIQLRTLIADWRRHWEDESLPFAWVQLPAFSGRNRPGWSIVREEMRRALDLPLTGMAVTHDLGDAHDLHPPHKRPVGERLAAWALRTVYGRSTPATGPTLVSIRASGRHLHLQFSSAEGMEFRGGAKSGFEIAGADRKWHPAEARIDGEAIVLASPAVPAPSAARYAWAASAPALLYNRHGLPASPFTTSDRD